MGKALSLIASAVIALVFIYAFTKKPKVKFDKYGFPLNPKDGDKFTKDGIVYTFGSGSWISEINIPGLIRENSSTSEVRSEDKVLVNQRVIRGFVMEGLPSTCPDWSNHLVVGLPKGIISSPDKVCFLVGIDSSIDAPCIMFKGKKYKFTFKDIIIYNGVKWQRYCYNKM